MKRMKKHAKKKRFEDEDMDDMDEGGFRQGTRPRRRRTQRL